MALEKFDIKNLTCCVTHSMALGLKNENENNNKTVQKTSFKSDELFKPILSIVEVIILSSNNETIQNDFISILHSFNAKTSPCFLIHLFNLLKVLLYLS